VHYSPDGTARAAAVTCTEPTFAGPLTEHVVRLTDVAPYRPGAFFERELPAIAAVLAGVPPIDVLIVDGYATLDPSGRPGLGAYAYELLGVPVIGVAKTAFHSATHAIPVLRGSATKPLYVTAAGMPATAAAELVRALAGPYRIPDALRRADTLARGA
jgi:deoxyribonuclease V